MAIDIENVTINSADDFEANDVYVDGNPLAAHYLNVPMKKLKRQINHLQFFLKQFVDADGIDAFVSGNVYGPDKIVKYNDDFYITLEAGASTTDPSISSQFKKIVIPGVIQQAANQEPNLDVFTQNFIGIVEQDLLVDGFSSAYSAEILRGMGGSGFYINRNYNADDGFSAMHRPFTMGSTQFHQHNHPNYYRMIGLGEQTAIVNGYYVRTTHNDPRLITGSGVELNAPPIPAEVLAKPTGVTMDGTNTVIDTANDTQARYFRNQFSENIADCRLDLVYLEMWIQKLPEGGAITDDSLSFRHFENANTLRSILNSSEKLNFSGAKDTQENGSFRCGVITFVDDEGNPTYGYITYRLRAQNVGTPAPRVAKTSWGENDTAPQINFGVVSASFGGTHGHALETPLTADEMNLMISGGTLYAMTSYNKAEASPDSENHAHLWELTWSGTTVTGKSVGASTATTHTFIASDSNYTPVISNYRMSDGTYSNNVVTWLTMVTPHVHPLDVKIIEDRFPFDLYKAVNHIIDNTNRYKLVKDQELLQRLRLSNPNATWKELAESYYARFTMEQNDMINICESIWGLDGEGAYIEEDINSYGSVYSTYDPANPTDRLNMARYNRTYGYGAAGASGRTTARRGFSDPTLFVAKTTNAGVEQGYTWMIPLELVTRAPVEIWNPWDLVLIDGSPSNGGSGNGTQTSPWNAAYTQLWYSMLPNNFFSVTPGDPADTTAGGTWVMSNDGNAYPVDNSGIWIKYDTAGNYLTPQGAAYSTVFRQRTLIAPVWHEFTFANQQLNNFKTTVRDLMKDIISGTATIDDVDDLI